MAGDAAERWQRMRAARMASMAAATKLMLDLAGVNPGCRVLDVAAGTGDQTVEAALRVGPSGHVLATDLSPNMLKAAAEAVHEAGLTNVDTYVADCQELNLEPGSFDAAICRMGLMFFPDRQKALGCIQRVLKPLARLSAAVWSTPERNPWLLIPTQIVEQHGGATATMRIGFSLAEPGLLERELASAGFHDVSVEAVPSNRHFDSFEAATESLKATPAAEAIRQLPEGEQASVWSEIQAHLRRFEASSGYEIPGEALVAVGTK